MSFIDVKFIKQLKDMAQDVSQRKCKNRNCFSQKTLLEWFNKKIKIFRARSYDKKYQYERKHPIN